MGVGAAGSPGVLRNVKLVVEMQTALLELAEDELGGHQLDQRGGGELRVGVLFVKHRAALVVDEQRLRGGALESLGARRARQRQRQRYRHEDELEASGHGGSLSAPRRSARLFWRRLEDKSTTERRLRAEVQRGSPPVTRAKGSPRSSRKAGVSRSAK